MIALRPPQGGMPGEALLKTSEIKAGIERLQHVIRGHAVMRAAPDADDTQPEFARHLDGRGHGLGADDEAKAVLSVELADHRRHALDLQIRASD